MSDLADRLKHDIETGDITGTELSLANVMEAITLLADAERRIAELERENEKLKRANEHLRWATRPSHD